MISHAYNENQSIVMFYTPLAVVYGQSLSLFFLYNGTIAFLGRQMESLINMLCASFVRVGLSYFCLKSEVFILAYGRWIHDLPRL